MYSKSTGYIKYILAVTALVYSGLGNAALVPINAAMVPIIDQEQNVNNISGGLASFNQPDLAQSFIQSQSNIVGAGIFLAQPFRLEGGRIDIELWDQLPSTGGANLLRTGMTDAHSNSWADVFWDMGAYQVAANTTLFLVLTGANNNMFIASNATSKTEELSHSSRS